MRRTRVVLFVALSSAVAAACGWDPSHPFDRDAPSVKEAVHSLDDGGDATAAASLLEDYLSTGKCSEGSIGTPAAVREKSNGSLDLGLALFRMGESYGARFGDEAVDAGQNPERSAQIDCALKVVQAIAENDKTPLELRARARYLEGNLHFLAGDYEPAVTAYDQALTLAPGMNDAGDPIGQDAAWNRAIALRRIDEKDAGGQDAAPGDSGPPSDGGGDGGQGDAAGGDGGGGGGSDAGSSGQDSGTDASSPPSGPPDAGSPDADSQPPTSKSQDERMLDQLERAPTVPQDGPKKHRRVLVDK